MGDKPDLDVDSLRHPHESPTEWNLRRKFLLAHKDSLSRSSLLCMASCFINMELSGCTYPPAVMARVRGLAEAVKDDAESGRSQVKAHKKRKLVHESVSFQPGTLESGDGTSVDTLPSNSRQPAVGTKRPSLAGISFVKSTDSCSTTAELPTVPLDNANKDKPPINPKFLQCREPVKECVVLEGSDRSFDFVNESPKPPEFAQDQRPVNPTRQTIELPDFVLYYNENNTVSSAVLRQTSNCTKIPLQFDCRKSPQGRTCVLKLGHIYTGGGEGKTNLQAKRNASEKALRELRKCYYTIQVKKCPNDVDEVYIGEHGIADPVLLDGVIHREALGLGTGSGPIPNLKQKVQQMVEDYVRSDDRKDLVFSADLTTKDRTLIAHLINKMKKNLKLPVDITTYHTSAKEHYLVVSKKPSWMEIFQNLIECGGENAKYRLIVPEQLEALQGKGVKALPTSQSVTLKSDTATSDCTSPSQQPTRGTREAGSCHAVQSEASGGVSDDSSSRKTQPSTVSLEIANEEKPPVDPEFLKCKVQECLVSECSKRPYDAIDESPKPEFAENQQLLNPTTQAISRSEYDRLFDAIDESPKPEFAENQQLLNPTTQAISRSEYDRLFDAIDESPKPPEFAENKQLLNPTTQAISRSESLSKAPDFVLYEHEMNNKGSISVLRQTSNSIKIPLQVDCQKCPQGVRCMLQLGHIYMGRGEGNNEKHAQKNASEKALRELRKRYYTIQVKKRVEDVDAGVDIGENRVITREELGLGSAICLMPEFKQNVHQILEDYKRNGDRKELVFSADLISQERKAITGISKQLDLKPKTCTKSAEECYLVVSMKPSWIETFRSLIECGGENDEYRLISPGQHKGVRTLDSSQPASAAGTSECTSPSQQPTRGTRDPDLGSCRSQQSESVGGVSDDSSSTKTEPSAVRSESLARKDFVLYEQEMHAYQSCAVLRQSSKMNEVAIQYTCSQNPQGVTCILKLQHINKVLPDGITKRQAKQLAHIYTGTGEGIDKNEAKQGASEKALRELRQCYYTVQAKVGVYADVDIDEDDFDIADLDTGSKVLIMKGLTRCDIEKAGQGAAEPVLIDGVMNIQRLSLETATGLTPQFEENVRQMLEDYVRNGDREDLVFSADLTNEERKVIHQMGRQFDLKTKSYNRSDEERFLVVSKKPIVMETFQSLIECGGENDKYCLIAPGQHKALQEKCVKASDTTPDLSAMPMERFESLSIREPEFVLHEEEMKAHLSRLVLLQTSNTSKIPVRFDYRRDALGQMTCILQLGHIYTGSAEGRSKKQAQKHATENAVRELRKRYYTIQAKNIADVVDDGVDVGRNVSSSTIPDTNIGTKIMKTMGWTGGGIGKQGQGIIEPVSLPGIMNRAGLGYGTKPGQTPQVNENIQRILKNYSRNGDQKELVLSDDLNDEEKKAIHQMGKKLNLKIKNRKKKNGERYLIVSKKVSWVETFQNLIECRGENERYRLILPGQHELLLLNVQ